MKKIFRPDIRICLVLLLVLIAILVSTTLLQSKSPEKRILGSWKEVSWEYEKVNKAPFDSLPLSKSISESIKKEIIGSLIIHEAENWEFLPNGKLTLNRENKDSEPLEWTLKGRGHVLKLKHPDNKTEYYNLQRVGKDEMVLYFSSDIVAKGIVKMVFKRNNG